LERITESLFGLACNYDVASFDVDYSILEGKCYITLRGHSRIQISHFKTPENATDEDVEKATEERMRTRIESDLKKLKHSKTKFT
jgi:hypothetical protein